MKITWKYEIKENEKVDPEKIVETILKHRKIKNIKEFLNLPSPLSINLSDFGFKKEIKTTLEFLKRIKKENQIIVVYTDYDADGITGGAILWETLHLLGFNVMPYVPHRKLEGYGFSIKGIDAVKKQFDPALIISVDHGITAKEKVSYAKSIGIPIIITDHHLQPDRLPTDAEAIFHISELSGSGVAYFFAKEIFTHFQKQPGDRTGKIHWQKIKNNFQTDYLTLAAIGTVADMVPLLGSSRSIVKHGLDVFSQTKRPGLKAVLKEAGIEGRKITPYEVGFIIAPRINAVGRLEHAIDALRLLCTKDSAKAHKLATNIGEKNRERQDMVTAAVEEAKRTINNQQLAINNKLIILVSDTWHEGIIGLIASKITEEFYRPTIIMTKTNGYLKGSARSIPSFHITDFLRSLKEFLIDVGGHKGAAGFTIEKKQLDRFCATASKLSSKLIKDKDLEKKIEADIKIPLSKVTLKAAKELERLQPFGIGNPQPMFYSQGTLVDAKLFGKKNEHLKIVLKESHQLSINNQQLTIEFVSFNAGNQFTKISRGQKMEIVYNLEINRWNSEEKIRGKIISLV